MNDFLKKSVNKTKQVGNVVRDNLVEPIVDNLHSAYKPITTYLDPRGYAAERANPQLGRQKFANAMKAMPNAALQTYGTSRMGATTPLASGTIGGLFNKVTGGSFGEGFKSGVKNAPSVAAVGSISNPAIGKFANSVGSKLTSPMQKFVAQRVASGVGAVPEGAVMNKSTGQDYTPKQTMIDFLQGAVFGSGAPNKPTSMNIRKTIDPYTLQEVDGLRDYLNRAIKGDKLPSMDYNQALNDVENIAQNFLTQDDIIRVSAKSKGNTQAVYYRNLLNEIAKRIGDYTSQYGGYRL